MKQMNTRKRFPLLALLLLVPVPSIGVSAGMIISPDFFGRAIFFISKMWILAIPLFWHLFVDKQKLSLSKPTNGGFIFAALLGIAASVVIIIFYFTFGRCLIEPQRIKEMAANLGLNNLRTYLLGAGYWIVINSALEEYVWRWFVVQKCKLILPVNAAILLSALCFTIHHIIAMQIYFDWLIVSAASIGIFAGGAVWSWCYNKYHSIWPGYISHAIVDVVVFAIGYILIFK